MTGIGNGHRPPWQPGDDLPLWAAKLQEDFPPAQIGFLPQVWCPKCRENGKKGGPGYCGMKAADQGSGGIEHVKAKCRDCGNSITKAHFHKNYVGHAHLTRRALDTDPRWTWEPMARDVPDEVMIAAVATGDLAIIQAVIAAYPPKIIEITSRQGDIERILWGNVIVHDEDGGLVVMPGVGDAIGKVWGPNAVKEMIGDLLRNALMRRGAGLPLWMKEDADRIKRERDAAGQPESASSIAAALFDGEENQDPPGKRAAAAGRARRSAPPDTGAAAGINPEAQAAADLAYQIATSGAADAIDKLFAAHEQAVKGKLLTLHCTDPADPATQTQVLKVFGRARATLEPKQQAKA